jgi:hypothetical protein
MILHPSPAVVSQGNKSTTISIVIGIVVLALLGGAWMGTKKSDDS